jgi:hypothetical protein
MREFRDLRRTKEQEDTIRAAIASAGVTVRGVWGALVREVVEPRLGFGIGAAWEAACA